jgi:TonB family protein
MHDRPPGEAQSGERACAFLGHLRFNPSVDPALPSTLTIDWSAPDDVSREAAAPPAIAAAIVPTGYVRTLPDGRADPCSTLVCESDYPPRARRTESEGAIIYHALVTAEGLPKSCWVSQPTTVEDLDKATCQIILTRARFTPARDEAGRARAAVYSGRMRWTLAN